MHVYVIVPAAGIGTRMAMSHPAGGVLATGSSPNPAAPKQFLTIGGVPVLIHSLRAFLAVGRVSAIYVAVRASEMERMKTHIADFGLGEKVHVVEGGENRQDSVSKALAVLEAASEDVVLVHDAVRPLIDPGTIDRTIDAVVKHGAAIVGLPAVDTIKQVERTANGALVTSTIPRERVVYAQTPQGAKYTALKRAFDEAAADEFLGTDEASLLERAGVSVVVVPGSARNFKITQPGDLELAEFYLKRAE
jgi:2-C-methyl-D-erythritol 4-phosphate cytidylyltransferase